MNLEEFRDFESSQGEEEKAAAIQKRLPQKIKKRRMVRDDEGVRKRFLRSGIR